MGNTSKPHRPILDLTWTFLILVAWASPAAFATTKGLNQIVTPDIQPDGELSLSFQAQDARIGNPLQLQAELGFTSWLEAAFFQGFSPSDQIFALEASVFHQDATLLSVGFLGLSTHGAPAQPFLEAGYYTVADKFILGGLWTGTSPELILGWAHDFDIHWRIQTDFQSGPENSFTLGVTYTMNEWFQVNPALYVSNSGAQAMGYGVVTFTLPLWRRSGR